MPYVLLDYRDGAYSVRAITDEEADNLMQQGGEVASVTDRVLAAWENHRNEAAVFYTMWQQLDNALSDRPSRPIDSEARSVDSEGAPLDSEDGDPPKARHQEP